MDFGPDGTIWVTRRFAHSVALVNPETGAMRTIETGRSPHGIWLNTHDSFPAQLSQAAGGRG
jgi:streptogramin lyase